MGEHCWLLNPGSLICIWSLVTLNFSSSPWVSSHLPNKDCGWMCSHLVHMGSGSTATLTRANWMLTMTEWWEWCSITVVHETAWYWGKKQPYAGSQKSCMMEGREEGITNMVRGVYSHLKKLAISSPLTQTRILVVQFSFSLFSLGFSC